MPIEPSECMHYKAEKCGHWEPWWSLGFEAYKCSVYGYHNTAKAIKSGTENYCCNCGAEMESE